MGKLPTTITSSARHRYRYGILSLLLGTIILCAACSPGQGGPAPVTEEVNAQTVRADLLVTATPSPAPTTTSSPTVTATPTQSPTPTLTATTSVTATPTLTPEPLPVFTTRLIRPMNLPQTYIPDTCAYLKLRWSPENSPPGTVVIPVMFHGIRESGKPVNDNITITEEQFQNFVQYAETLGFETITTAQLAQFLETNASIPPRSMIMIIDDRRPGTVETYFLPILKKNQWTATLGWIITDTNADLWQRMETMAATGLLDVQSHGFLHRYIVPEMEEAEVREEITASIPILEEHFGTRPVAFIWPGGNYTPLAVQVAREAGYRLGFTANSQGPLMFNWIPLGEAERAIGDPLMVLPRGWSTALGVNLDWAAQVGDQARAEAVERYADEADYYRTYCGGELPALKDVLP
jgi:peptidoglycan/xylan/chitin deacetylase (PgdA/CDA1 family)